MVSKECELTLQLLARSRNVLVSGAPGTGKSKLLSEVAEAFESGYGMSSSQGAPTHDPSAEVPIPPSAGMPNKNIPAPARTERKVFRTVFHQNSKYRDFVTGIAPSLSPSAGASNFVTVKGALYRASEHAKQPNGASLLIIDEINRGPAIQVFGGAIVAIEADKRLAPDGNKRTETQYFELLSPETGQTQEYALPHDLYILAAMNQADASVEPMDVAFLRRWEPLRLAPDEVALRSYYGLGPNSGNALPSDPSSAADALEASVRAWVSVNERLSLGRGHDFQIGHGVLMDTPNLSSLQLKEVLEVLCVGWAKIKAHVEEVFFGDVRGVAATLNALDGPSSNPFKLVETTFAGDLRLLLHGPNNFSASTIYPSLKAFSKE